MVILWGEWQQGREGAAVVQAREGLLHKQPVSVWVELLLVKITVHSMANLSVRCGRQQHTQMRDKAGERVGWESDGWLRGAGTASEAKKSVIYLGISGQSQTLQHSGVVLAEEPQELDIRMKGKVGEGPPGAQGSLVFLYH